MLPKNIVLIADCVDNHLCATSRSRDLEMLSSAYFREVWNALCQITSEVTHYFSPESFLDNIAGHKDDVVLSLWSGEQKRSRRALVPSICEAYGIPYVGADPYIQTICADKHLGKLLCGPSGIASAEDVLLYSEADIPLLKNLTFPVVIKPNFEGGSIGIFSENLADDYDTAASVSQKLLADYSPLIAEEYLKGEEISVCLAGIGQRLDIFEAVRICINKKVYFDHDILGAEVKKMEQGKRTREIVTKHFPEKEKQKIIDLYQKLGKVEVLRVDGRLDDGKFTLIELTPDCSLSRSSSVSLAFQQQGYCYAEMLERLCENAIKNQELEYQSASK